MTILSSLTLLTAVSLSFELFITPIRAQSVAVTNNCPSSVYVSSPQSSYFKGGAVASGSNINISTSGLGAGSSGFQLSFSTGCSSEGTGCATGPNGTSPLYSAVFFQSTAPNSITYNIDVFEGFNVGIEIEATGTSHCPAFACDGLGSGCPVPGPSGTCYSPCCSSALACKGGAPTECINPGVYDSFYASNCPNAQSHLDYNATALPGTQFACETSGLVVTLCPGFSSRISLAEIASGTFPTTVASAIPTSSSSTSSSSSGGASATGAPAAQSSKAPIGPIVGGVVGGIAAVALVAVAFLLWRRSRQTGGGGVTYEEMRERGVVPFAIDEASAAAAALPPANETVESATSPNHIAAYPYHTAASLMQYPPSKREHPPSTGTARSPTSLSTAERTPPGPHSRTESAGSSSRRDPRTTAPSENTGGAPRSGSDALSRGEGSSRGGDPLAEVEESANFDDVPPPSYEAEEGGGVY